MSVYDFKVKASNGKEISLADYKGQALLIVNVASKCGFTPQYEGLEKIYEKYKEQGFTVLGFPCNQFGGQEPGSDADIQSFCTMNFGVKFPLFKKIDVNGKEAHPLFQYLVKAKRGLLLSKRIKWNFTKFLIGKDGTPIKRYAPTVKPEALEADIQAALAQKNKS